MTAQGEIELFVLKCASLRLIMERYGIQRASASLSDPSGKLTANSNLKQFSSTVRANADAMAEHYKMLYMLENEIRKLIDDTLAEAYGVEWWEGHSPASAKEECKANQKREQEAGVTSRSESELDYISFGQLGDIIRENYSLFGGILSNAKAMGRVMFALNNLRGPIAHCGVLAEDEVDRLNLAVKDWFRLLEGPK